MLEVIEDGDMEDWVKVSFLRDCFLFTITLRNTTWDGRKRLDFCHFFCGLLPGPEQSGSGGVRAREVPAVPDVQQPPEHVAVAGGAGRAVPHLQQLHRGRFSLRQPERRLQR